MSSTDSRVKKSLLNARVNLIFYFLVLILSFFSRKIFLDTLGAEFIGFTSTLQNLLGFLNLAELGIATAIGYILYKPLFEHDELKINEIVSVLGYLYRCIGVVILAAGMILSIFLPLIFPNTEFKWTLIYFAYYSFLASSLIGYFINYRQNLLGADQKNYVVVGYFQSANILKTLLQIFLAYYYKNYYIWVAIELTFGILYSFVLNWKINQTYPWLKSEISEGRKLMKKYPEVVKYTKQLFVQKISSIVQWQTVPFLTYAFASLQMVAYYGNYTIITDKLADEFGIKKDDEITVKSSDDIEYKFKVVGITKNYVDHYIIISKELYESEVGKYKTNMIWVNLKTDDKDTQSKIFEDILNFEGVASVSVMSTFVKAISDMLNTMNYVVVVLIVTSAMLDFVVLYNLANINIGERQREIATLKVLGFYDKEVDNYINKENVIFTIIGIALGLVFGTFLTSAIISSIEIDRLRFTRNILTSSYIWSALITASFSFIVNKIIHFILKKIDMIESLKSVE